MLHMISWKEFFTLMGLGLLIYYGWLMMRYFPYGLGLNRVSRGIVSQPSVKRESLPANVSAPAQEKGIVQVHGLVAAEERQPLLPELAGKLDKELTALLEYAGVEKTIKPELLFALRRMLDKEGYAPLRGTLFQKKISEVIVSKLERYCSIRLDAEELSGLWIR